jgi:myo-inositol-1(or 4)-monophosphatase
MSAEYIALMNVAARIARQAGDLVYAGRRAGAGTVQTKSSATDMVTEWDAASEQLILQQLGLVRPGDSIIGEEGTQIVGTSPYTWFVDPIDGTTNFLYNLSGYAISIAACIGV